MGLDMFLRKFPRIGLKPRTIDAVEGFASWIRDGMEYTFEEWCGYTENDLPNKSKLVQALEKIQICYDPFDTNKECPYYKIAEEVGYWRKANAIHKWFVDNVQDGEDDCEYHHPVTREHLETLQKLCLEVLIDHNKAQELLPVTEGFFFGSYKYDEWYFEYIQKTAELCEELFENFDFEENELYYRSNW